MVWVIVNAQPIAYSIRGNSNIGVIEVHAANRIDVQKCMSS